MSRPEPPSRQRLPGSEIPSAEVLDELLRAFAVDVTDQQRMDRVDLASPEVEELLTPPVEAPPDPHPQPEVEVEVEVEVTGTDGQEESEPAAPEEPPPAEPPVEPGPTVVKTIVIDAADDPPDAVYLAAGDPLLQRPARPEPPTAGPPAGGADAPIFIDDHHTGETISMEAATSATRIEPRMRDRRIAVRRAAGRKRLRWAFVAGLVVIVVVAVLAVLGSSLFAIDDVEVEGAVYTNPDALAAVVAGLEGSPVLRADTDRAERDLEAIPWVEDARVTTDFPHGAKVEIRERSPVATFEGPDARFRVIDSDGRVLDVLDSQPVEYLLLLSAEPPGLEPGQFAPQGFAAAASLTQALTPELRAQAESVTVTPDGTDLRLLLVDGVEVRFGAARDLVVKLVRLHTRLDELDGGPMSYVDVSTNEVTTG